MKSLQQHLTEYIAARRALGTRLQEPAHTLCQFVRLLARKQARFITIPLALEWAPAIQGCAACDLGSKAVDGPSVMLSGWSVSRTSPSGSPSTTS